MSNKLCLPLIIIMAIAIIILAIIVINQGGGGGQEPVVEQEWVPNRHFSMTFKGISKWESFKENSEWENHIDALKELTNGRVRINIWDLEANESIASGDDEWAVHPPPGNVNQIHDEGWIKVNYSCEVPVGSFDDYKTWRIGAVNTMLGDRSAFEVVWLHKIKR